MLGQEKLPFVDRSWPPIRTLLIILSATDFRVSAFVNERRALQKHQRKALRGLPQLCGDLDYAESTRFTVMFLAFLTSIDSA
jgi:hypothetical protein